MTHIAELQRAIFDELFDFLDRYDAAEWMSLIDRAHEPRKDFSFYSRTCSLTRNTKRRMRALTLAAAARPLTSHSASTVIRDALRQDCALLEKQQRGNKAMVIQFLCASILPVTDAMRHTHHNRPANGAMLYWPADDTALSYIADALEPGAPVHQYRQVKDTLDAYVKHRAELLGNITSGDPDEKTRSLQNLQRLSVSRHGQASQADAPVPTRGNTVVVVDFKARRLATPGAA